MGAGSYAARHRVVPAEAGVVQPVAVDAVDYAVDRDVLKRGPPSSAIAAWSGAFLFSGSVSPFEGGAMTCRHRCVRGQQSLRPGWEHGMGRLSLRRGVCGGRISGSSADDPVGGSSAGRVCDGGARGAGAIRDGEAGFILGRRRRPLGGLIGSGISAGLTSELIYPR